MHATNVQLPSRSEAQGHFDDELDRLKELIEAWQVDPSEQALSDLHTKLFSTFHYANDNAMLLFEKEQQ